MFENKNYEIMLGDCIESLKKLDDNSIDMVATDPPYFFLGMDEGWDEAEMKVAREEFLNKNQEKWNKFGNFYLEGFLGNKKGGGTYGSAKTIKFQEFMKNVSDEIFRVLKPGSFYFAFSQPRMVHRAMLGIEDAGFYLRELMIWYHPNGSPFRAGSLARAVEKSDRDEETKKDMINKMGNLKTPMPAVLYEPIVFAQKPPEGSLMENYAKWGVGLMELNRDAGGQLPSNVFYFSKPLGEHRKEKYNIHPTVKPIELMEYLINTFSKKGDIILDPFLGSGTTVVAALNRGRKGIGMELNEEYIAIAERRIKESLQITRLF